jgi:death on curing protein
MDEHVGLPFFYLDVRHAVEEHDWIIEVSGGMPGINNLANLESPLAHIQNDVYYPNLIAKLTHLVYSINKNHAFNDGNKRSSILLGAYFLQLNGYDFAVNRFVHEMENIAVYVASNTVNKDLLHDLIRDIVYEEDYSEPLKLKLIEAATAFNIQLSVNE